MLQSLSRRFLLGMCAAALLEVGCASMATAQVRHYVAPEREQSVSPLNYKTPADEYLLPYLQTHSSGPLTAPNVTPVPMQNNYVTTPAFGGYVNAPMFDARTTASLATGTTNNGVTAEVTADFNKDGKPDVAVLQQDGTLNILLNNGAGGLNAPVSYLNPNLLTGSINVAYAVDVNGDGYADVVAFDYNNNTTITWLNLGNGTFNAAVTAPLDSTYGYPNFIYVADVNGDGKADVLFGSLQALTTSSANVTLEVMFGKGDGTFGTPAAAKVQTFKIAASGTMPSNAGIALGDINGDGKLDLALVIDERLTSSTGTYVVTTALGNGDGTFSTLGVSTPITAGVVGVGIRAIPQYTSSAVNFADVNGDGKLDLVADINGVLEAALGNGDGSFQTPVTSTYSYVPSLAKSVLLDVNGDGKLDAVCAGGTMAVYIGKGDGTFGAPVQGSAYIIDPAGYQSLVIGDFNADGKQDIAQLGEDFKQVSLFFGNGTGGFRGAPVVADTASPNPVLTTLLGSGKYTANGYSSPLLAYAGTTAQLVVNVNDGKGNFTSVTALPSYPSDLRFIEPIHADFNGDGLEDLVYANTTGNVLVALSKGDGTFATPVSLGLPVKPCPVYYGTAGDVNGDGKMDMVIPYGGDKVCGSTAGTVSGYYVALGNGDGTFAAPTFVTYGTVLYSLQLADLNGDGKLDLVLNDEPLVANTGFRLSTAIGKGDGTFGTPVNLLTNYLISSVVAADVNNDGKADLVLSSRRSAEQHCLNRRHSRDHR